MNELVAKYPGKELHVVLDNLNTHMAALTRFAPLLVRARAAGPWWVSAVGCVLRLFGS